MKVTRELNPVPKPKAWLVIHGGPQDGDIYTLRKVTTTIGKDPKLSDFVLQDPTISREHIRLKLDGDTVTLTDLASLNGTMVNNQRVQKQLLRDDDVVSLGNTTIVFKCVSPKVGN